MAEIDRDEAAVLASLISPGRVVNARRDIVREGARAGTPILIVSGWACQYRTLEDGRRQILSFLIPGDVCGLQDFILPQMDHTIGALKTVRYASLPSDLVDRLNRPHPRLKQAMWRQMLTAISVQREWAVSLGQRNSMERVGHLICEMYLRLRTMGQVSGLSYDFPLTQNDIAEATGLTQVHVNRTLRQLRVDGLIELADRVMTIPNLKALMRASLFSAAYLHLGEDRSVHDVRSEPARIVL